MPPQCSLDPSLSLGILKQSLTTPGVASDLRTVLALGSRGDRAALVALTAQLGDRLKSVMSKR